MKGCRNTKLIYISILLLLSTLLFRNVIEPFDVPMTPTEAVDYYNGLSKAAHDVLTIAENEATAAQAAYDSAMSRFQATPTQVNGVALSNAQALKIEKDKMVAAKKILADEADADVATATASIYVASPPPPPTLSDLEMSAQNATIVTPTPTWILTIIGIALGILFLYFIYLILFSKRAAAPVENSSNYVRPSAPTRPLVV